MPRKRTKKPMGRPPKNPLPPKIDAPPEVVAHAVLNAGRPKGRVSEGGYFCADCKRQVAYPETLYNDGLCEQCHQTGS